MTPHHFVNKLKNKIETFKAFASRILKSTSFQSGGGFTLLEAVIAIFIITIGIVAVLQMFPLSIQQQTLAKMATVAGQLAQEKIEEFIAKSYDDISIATTTEDYGEITGFPTFKRVTARKCVNPNFQVVPCNYDPDNDPNPVKKVEVIVYWKSPLGVTKKDFKIATLISKR